MNPMQSTTSAADKKVRVELVYTDMTAADAAWWDQRLQVPFHQHLAARADRNWRWQRIFGIYRPVSTRRGRQTRALVIWAPRDDGLLLRVGMSLVIEHYPHLDTRQTNPPADAHYLWFISGADKDVLQQHFSMSHPPSLMRVHLDLAMVMSVTQGSQGQIGLHAAPEGGSTLFGQYQHCGLLALPATVRLPTSVRLVRGAMLKGNDGRFFYTNAPLAAALLTKMDPFR